MSNDRLNKIDNTLERLTRIIEVNSQQIGLENQYLEVNNKKVDALTKSVERLVEVLRRMEQIVDTEQADFREFKLTTQAGLERVDRILEYLVRQYGDRDDIK